MSGRKGSSPYESESHAEPGRSGPGTIVEVRQLQKIYRGNIQKGHADVMAVNNVDLKVREGELVVLLGPSGCGKTTLLRCIAGLEKPFSGEIRINQRTVYSSAQSIYVPPEERHIGMMFQSYALWPHMTVFQNVAYPLTSLPNLTKEMIRDKVQAVLASLGVSGFDHRYPGELSGGQQQRVALARALVGSPSVLLFDEPLSNVDAKVRRRLRAQLRELKHQTSFAGVYVTHDQEEAMELADTLAVMEDGQIRQLASSREVYHRPASIYVAGFVGEINRLAARINALKNGVADVATELGIFSISDLPANAKIGDVGFLIIRPEHVRLLSRGESVGTDANALDAHIHDAIYLGARFEYHLKIGNMKLMAWLPDHSSAVDYPQKGSDIQIVLPKDSLRWLPD